jgi:hypothetical protein
MAPPGSVAGAARRSAFALVRLMLCLALAALFLGALFYSPVARADLAASLQGHVERARLIAAGDDGARADAYEYVAGRWSLLSVLMLDIRHVVRVCCVLRQRIRAGALRAAKLIAMRFARAADAAMRVRRARRSIIIPLLHVAIGTTAFLSAMVAADRLYHYYVVRHRCHVTRAARCVCASIVLTATHPLRCHGRPSTGAGSPR